MKKKNDLIENFIRLRIDLSTIDNLPYYLKCDLKRYGCCYILDCYVASKIINQETADLMINLIYNYHKKLGVYWFNNHSERIGAIDKIIEQLKFDEIC